MSVQDIRSMILGSSSTAAPPPSSTADTTAADSNSKGSSNSNSKGSSNPRKRKRVRTKTKTKTKKPKKPKTKASILKKRATATPSVEAALAPVMEETKVVEAAAKRPLQSLESLGYAGVMAEVDEMEDDDVVAAIEAMVIKLAKQVLADQGITYEVPSRASGNQQYVKELNRIVLKDKKTTRSFAGVSSVRKTAITTRVLQLIHELCSKGIHVTKRDLFYTDVKLFEQQGETDNVLDDVATMVGCTRTSLNVVASEKGVIVGRVSFRDAGDLIDCTRMGVGGKAIPPFTERITDIQSDAKFILVVEKDAAFMRLAEDRFYQTYPSIIITAKGQPDVSTRRLLKRLKEELNIPVLGLFDSDPYGLKILSVYMSGSKNLSYDSGSLATPDIKWLGVRPSDLDRYDIPDQCRLPMTDQDIKTGQALLKEDYIQCNKEWVAELKLMLKTKVKAEIQSLSAFGFQYLTQEYLPRKLAAGDWI